MISVKNAVIFVLLCDKVVSLLLDKQCSGKGEGPVVAKMEMGDVGKTYSVCLHVKSEFLFTHLKPTREYG